MNQTPRPSIPEIGTPWGTPTTIHYNEGAEIGYRWYEKTNKKPMYSFGYGLSYTTFQHSNFEIKNGKKMTVSFTVTNTGNVAGADVQHRLLGFERVELKPGESKIITLEIEPRLLATFVEASKKWHIKAGEYEIGLGTSATTIPITKKVSLKNQLF